MVTIKKQSFYFTYLQLYCDLFSNANMLQLPSFIQDLFVFASRPDDLITPDSRLNVVSAIVRTCLITYESRCHATEPTAQLRSTSKAPLAVIDRCLLQPAISNT